MPAFVQVMVAALTAMLTDCERVVSVYRKAHLQSVVRTLTLINDRSCYGLNISEEIVALEKRAAYEYNRQYQ